MLNRRIACLLPLIALFAGACTTDFSLSRLDAYVEGSDATLDVQGDNPVVEAGDVPPVMDTGPCPTGATACGAMSTCVDLQTDVAHCGRCGNACPMATVMQQNSARSCTAGACGFSCTGGFANCDMNAMNGCEADLATSVRNCGTCGTACETRANATTTCAAGTCGFECDEGFADCDGVATNGCEVDLRASTVHCGRCGNVCPTPMNANGTAACTMGVCGFQCSANYGDCDHNLNNGCEVDLRADPANCSACGSVCPRGINGRAICAPIEGSDMSCGIRCAANFGDCNEDLADGCEQSLRVPSSCGGCGASMRCATGQVCARQPEGTYACAAGCPAGQTNCNGSCIDTQNDPDNCGGCGSVCAPRAGSERMCAAGVCTYGCQEGFGDCDTSNPNCETNTQTDAMNCGMCGRACSLPHATSTCSTGACAVGTCEAGYADCNGVASDGCEVAVGTTATNCGACGRVCAGANVPMPTCAAGVCGGACAAGFRDCDGDPNNGCETSMATATNCGACGVRCAADQVCAAVASGGSAYQCQARVTTCPTGQTMCDGACVSTATDISNCGACRRVCPGGANATATCTSGTCGLSCSTGSANCDGMAANGCETDLRSTATRCGTCTTNCTTMAGATASGQCSSGTCTFTCNAGRLSCNGPAGDADKCETDPMTDPMNCGACGNVCGSGAACRMGVCECSTPGQVRCVSGMSAACVSTQTSSANCGACNNACPSGTTCANGACVCAGGQLSCGGTCVNAQTDRTNCGVCGNACPTGTNCVAGACTCATAGQILCNGTCVDPRTSNSHCGACNNRCAMISGMGCTAGVCPMCPAGQTRCDSATGATATCVTSTSDPSNCGACGNVCPTAPNATAACASGTCGLTCTGANRNCDGITANGCEVDTTSNNSHCGVCGRVCPAGRTCTASACACNEGTTDCGGTCVNRMTDRNNCGACGNACTGGKECRGGVCLCPTGQTACTPPLGAETCVNLTNNTSNCGACNNACPPTGMCTNSACVCPAPNTRICGPALLLGPDRCCVPANGCGLGANCL